MLYYCTLAILPNSPGSGGIATDDNEATKAASEFRGCGFIVTTEKFEVDT
jgi:hypothetical protein